MTFQRSTCDCLRCQVPESFGFFSGGSSSDFTFDLFDNHADMNALPADFFGLLLKK